MSTAEISSGISIAWLRLNTMAGMGRLPKRTLRKIYLGEWIEALGRDRKDVAAGAGIDVSYVNNLIGGGKGNPSAHVMLALSEYLGISVNDLYRPPPPKPTIESFLQLSAAARESLFGRNRRK